MRILLCLFVLLFALSSGNVFSQQDTTITDSTKTGATKHTKKFQTILKADLALPVLGILGNIPIVSATAEFGYRKRYSFQFTTIFIHNENYGDNYRISNLMIIPEFKYFLSKKKTYTGFYAGAFSALVTISNKQKNNTQQYHENYHYYRMGIAAGGIFGYQNYIQKRIVVDVLIGFGLFQSLFTDVINGKDKGVQYARFDPLPIPRLALNVGYRF